MSHYRPWHNRSQSAASEFGSQLNSKLPTLTPSKTRDSQSSSSTQPRERAAFRLWTFTIFASLVSSLFLLYKRNDYTIVLGFVFAILHVAVLEGIKYKGMEFPEYGGQGWKMTFLTTIVFGVCVLLEDMMAGVRSMVVELMVEVYLEAQRRLEEQGPTYDRKL